MKTIRLEFFPESRVALDREIKKHPELQELLDNHPADQFELRLTEVATYCGVILHGEYSQKDFDSICDRLRKVLIKKRTGLFLM